MTTAIGWVTTLIVPFSAALAGRKNIQLINEASRLQINSEGTIVFLSCPVDDSNLIFPSVWHLQQELFKDCFKYCIPESRLTLQNFVVRYEEVHPLYLLTLKEYSNGRHQ